MSGMSYYDMEQEEREARLDNLRADTKLKTRQELTEWPKVFTAALLAVAALFGAVGTMFGYSLRH